MLRNGKGVDDIYIGYIGSLNANQTDLGQLPMNSY